MFFAPQITQTVQYQEEEKIEPSDNQKKLLSSLGITIMKSLRPILEMWISQLRAQLIIYTNKKLENILRQRQIINDKEIIERGVQIIEKGASYANSLPIEALKGIPFLYELANKSRDILDQSSSRARNWDYTINMINDKEMAYDVIIQKLDSLIRQGKGILDQIEIYLERGTV